MTRLEGLFALVVRGPEIDCGQCDGEGTRYYDVGREPDGTPIEALRPCEGCEGTGKVALRCPECERDADVLVSSDFSDQYVWCVSCALTNADPDSPDDSLYAPDQITALRAQEAQHDQ